jgi:hypothetical protein
MLGHLSAQQICRDEKEHHQARNGCLDLEGVGLDQNKVHEQHPVARIFTHGIASHYELDTGLPAISNFMTEKTVLAAGMRVMLALGYHLRFLGAAKAFR